MKKIFILIFMCGFINCKSQPKKIFTKNKNTSSKSSIKKEGAHNQFKNTNMDSFDIKRYNANRNEDTKIYDYTLTDGSKVEESDGGYADSRYGQIIKKPGSLIEIVKGYYESGRLKVKGQQTKNFLLGIWYEYDENGKTIKETNHDKPFTYTWEDIKKYCKEKNIDMFSGKTNVKREITYANCYWGLSYEGLYEEKPGVYKIKLDGKTGEICLVERFKGIKTGGVGKVAEYEKIFEKTK